MTMNHKLTPEQRRTRARRAYRHAREEEKKAAWLIGHHLRWADQTGPSELEYRAIPWHARRAARLARAAVALRWSWEDSHA